MNICKKKKKTIYAYRLTENAGIMTNVEVREFLESMESWREKSRCWCLNKCGVEVTEKNTYCPKCAAQYTGVVNESLPKKTSTCETVQKETMMYLTQYASSKNDDRKKLMAFVGELRRWERENVKDEQNRLRPLEVAMLANIRPKGKAKFKPMIENWGSKDKDVHKKTKNRHVQKRFTKSQRAAIVALVQKHFPYTPEEIKEREERDVQ